MNCYLDDSTSTDAISERLRDVCPSLYSDSDALCTKVPTNNACVLWHYDDDDDGSDDVGDDSDSVCGDDEVGGRYMLLWQWLHCMFGMVN